MKSSCALLALAFIISACSTAAAAPVTGNLCGKPFQFVRLETGHDNPPQWLRPDIGANAETPQEEWDLTQYNQPITLHCYFDKLGVTDTPMPIQASRCIALDNKITCN